MKKSQAGLFLGLFTCLLTVMAPVFAQDKDSPGMAPKSNSSDAPIVIVYLLKDQKIIAGEKITIQFKLLDKDTGEPKNDLEDAHVLVFLAPGIWQKRLDTKFLNNGIYEFEVIPPQPGLYYIYVEVPSLKVKFKDLPSRKFEAVDSSVGVLVRGHCPVLSWTSAWSRSRLLSCCGETYVEDHFASWPPYYDRGSRWLI